MIPLLVIRHAPTDVERGGRIQGRTDTPLSENGQATGSVVADSCRLGWRALRRQPAARATETARLLGLRPKRPSRR